jgi:adenosylcobinamide kinase/adenosylcobinamide-phosphate guanylyltransferase
MTQPTGITRPAGLQTGTHFILGGARSGKTAHALGVCEAAHKARGLTPLYIATAQAHDDEMRHRIAAHKAERGPHWQGIEAPLDLAAAVRAHASAQAILLVDCLTLWVTNLMLAERDVDKAGAELIAALEAAHNDACGPVVVVSNEVGLGIVPDNAMARQFRDLAGRLHQDIAAAAQKVDFIAAGLPLTLKS